MMWRETKEFLHELLINAALIVGACFLNWLWDFALDYVIVNYLGQKDEIIIGILNMAFNYFFGGILNLINLGVAAYTLWNIGGFIYYYLSYPAIEFKEWIGKFLGTIAGTGLLVGVVLGVVIAYIKLSTLFENAITLLVMMIAIHLLLVVLFFVIPLLALCLLFSAHRFVFRRNQYFYLLLPIVIGVDIYIAQFLYDWFASGVTTDRALELLGVAWDYYKAHCVTWGNQLNEFFEGNKSFNGLFK
ncbi:hypothetical protein [Megasphaera sp. DISK 18]|uniref:hypothetical protein n=1 Tax=Megasphaera sp. DISK 18 TaxID=1776081 RepID=UPI001146AF2A|nr:hypothetical protein [Megasphaera sp. DISK 18]